jgi:hypothetical protein
MLDPRPALRSALDQAARLGRLLTNTRAPKWRWRDNIPVAGIDGATAEAITYFLRQQAPLHGDASVADLWLCALQLAQVAHDRLMHDLSGSRWSLSFWKQRLSDGSHTKYMLLNNGPLGFLRTALSAAHLIEPEKDATARISQRIAFLTYQSAILAEALAEVNLAAGGCAQLVRSWCGPQPLAS